MIRSVVAVGALAAVLASPAWADCAAEIGQLEQHIHDAQASVELEGKRIQTDQGGVMLESEDGGVAPRENWFGSPSSVAHAVEELENARRLAASGDESGCMYHVDFAKQIMSGFQP